MPFRIFLGLCLLFCFSSCSSDDSAGVDLPPEIDQLTFLALGDSYTIGSGVDTLERFPYQLAAALNERDIAMDTPEYIAQSGWRADQLLDAIDFRDITDTFDLVSLLIGVNNQFQNRLLSRYEMDFATLLDYAIERTGGRPERVMVVSIPDYAFTPFGQTRPEPDTISAELDIYNNVNRQQTEDAGAAYFYITDISRRGLDEPELVASDELHPSAEQYHQWVNSFVNEVVEMLSE